MAQLTWSPRSVRDLEDIGEFISCNSKHYAKIVVQGIKKLAGKIPQQPRLGGMVPEYERDDLRERLFHEYRILYRIRAEQIEIVRVVHGARPLPPIPSMN